MFNPDEIWPIFVGVWVILAITGFLLFFVSKNAKLKRNAWPPFVIGTGVLFALFVYLMGFPVDTFVVVGPVIILIMVLNLRSVKFCDECGKTIMNQNPFARREFCSKCGSKLNT